MSEDSRPYRPCVGIMLVNVNGDVFVGNRIDTHGDHWQMPQGGVDDGEEPAVAVMRELGEEIGTAKATIIAESKSWHAYDLPRELSRRIWKGRYRGQTQKWFLMRFDGSDADINLEAHKAEFSEWRWSPIDELCTRIVPFKRDIYTKVVAEFSTEIATLQNP